MNLLTKEQPKPYKKEKVCYIFKEKFENKYVKGKSFVKSEIIVIVKRNIDVLRIAYVT